MWSTCSCERKVQLVESENKVFNLLEARNYLSKHTQYNTSSVNLLGRRASTEYNNKREGRHSIHPTQQQGAPTVLYAVRRIARRKTRRRQKTFANASTKLEAVEEAHYETLEKL